MRDPGAGRCDREREPEKEVRGVRESFCQGIEKDNGERGWCEESCGSVNGRTGDQKSNRADREKCPRRGLSHEPVSSRRAGIHLVKRPIAQTVEEHGSRARENHAGEHEEQGARGRAPVGRDEQRPQCKRQSENCVGETDQPEKTGDRIGLRNGIGVRSSHRTVLLIIGEKLLQPRARSGENRCPVRKEDALKRVV